VQQENVQLEANKIEQDEYENEDEKQDSSQDAGLCSTIVCAKGGWGNRETNNLKVSISF